MNRYSWPAAVVDVDINWNSAANVVKDRQVSAKTISLRQELKLGVRDVKSEKECSRTAVSCEKASEIHPLRANTNSF